MLIVFLNECMHYLIKEDLQIKATKQLLTKE